MNVATEHDDAHDGHHICGVGTYLSIFGALMVLTLITVVVAFQDLGPFNNLAALGIAFLKVFLVVTVFMHLRYNAQIIWIVAGASFIWLVNDRSCLSATSAVIPPALFRPSSYARIWSPASARPETTLPILPLKPSALIDDAFCSALMPFSDS